MTHNCGITKIELDGNDIPASLLLAINVELEKNQAIVDIIFPVVTKHELHFLKKKAKDMRKRRALKKRMSSQNIIPMRGAFGTIRHQGSALYSKAQQLKGNYLGIETLTRSFKLPSQRFKTGRSVAFLGDKFADASSTGKLSLRSKT